MRLRETPALPRTLAVILHADVVDSTRLVRDDESRAHQRTRAAFKSLANTVKRYGGTSREIRGDALVAEFSRASDAVSAALAGQTDNRCFNQTLDAQEKLELRIGIGIGEVIVADKTVTGAGVVMAKRLEQLATPCGVCIQGAAYETVPRRRPFDYENLGAQTLKGFDEPVQAYTVAKRAGTELPVPDRKPRRTFRWFTVATLLLVTLVFGFDRTSLTLPDAPAIETYRGCVLVVDSFILCRLGADTSTE